MKFFEVAPEAEADLRDILRESHRKFGRAAATRYHLLINAAYAALADDPMRAGVITAGRRLKMFHTRHLRRQARVANPRHVVIFISDNKGVRIVRLFHDAMDLPARLADL